MRTTMNVNLPADMSRQADGAIAKAFLQGVVDGLDQPDELTSGMTYTKDRNCQQAYDEGANLGQAVGRLFGRVPAETGFDLLDPDTAMAWCVAGPGYVSAVMPKAQAEAQVSRMLEPSMYQVVTAQEGRRRKAATTNHQS
mgnify:CR=1 FL=1